MCLCVVLSYVCYFMGVLYQCIVCACMMIFFCVCLCVVL